MLEEYDPTKIQDEHAREAVQKVLNLLEKTFVQVDKLREENQKLRDELALLKGEQPKPKILPNKPTSSISSEKERQARTERGAGCWDIFQTLVERCKKLGVNFYE